jgi:hypothetical protein
VRLRTSHAWRRPGGLRENLFDDIALHVGQSEIAAVVPLWQPSLPTGSNFDLYQG